MAELEIFVDIDGVLADFVSASIAVHGGQYDEEAYPKLEWSIANVLGITESEFWAKIDATEPNFWPNLDPYPWALNLLESVRTRGRVSLLSTPSKHSSCHSGKRQWVDRWVSDCELILCKSKDLLSGPGRVLIDDNDGNCEKWRARGGTAILFPQPWNQNHALTGRRFGYVIEQLTAAAGYESDENPKDAIGRKKTALRLVPSALLINVANVMKLGAGKYGEYNWRTKRVKRTVYLEAAMRHLLAALDGDDSDPESGSPHEAHVAACMGIVLDAMAIGNMIDDRPTPGAATKLMEDSVCA